MKKLGRMLVLVIGMSLASGSAAQKAIQTLSVQPAQLGTPRAIAPSPTPQAVAPVARPAPPVAVPVAPPVAVPVTGGYVESRTLPPEADYRLEAFTGGCVTRASGWPIQGPYLRVSGTCSELPRIRFVLEQTGRFLIRVGDLSRRECARPAPAVVGAPRADVGPCSRGYYLVQPGRQPGIYQIATFFETVGEKQCWTVDGSSRHDGGVHTQIVHTPCDGRTEQMFRFYRLG